MGTIILHLAHMFKIKYLFSIREGVQAII